MVIFMLIKHIHRKLVNVDILNIIFFFFGNSHSSRLWFSLESENLNFKYELTNMKYDKWEFKF